MTLYGTKTIANTLFVSRGVLFDYMKSNNGKAKEQDIKVITINCDDTGYPAHVYKNGEKDEYSLIPGADTIPIDIILQRYPEREKTHDTVLEKVKNLKGVYSCMLPVNANRDGYLSANSEGLVEYFTDTKFYPIDKLRAGIANVTVVDEVNKTITAKMYNYCQTDLNVISNVWKKLAEDTNDIPIAPVYNFINDNMMFSVIQSMKNTYVVFNIVNEDTDDTVVIEYEDVSYYISELEAVAFIRDIHNMNGKREISCYTTNVNFNTLKSRKIIYKKLTDLASMTIPPVGDYKKNGIKYRISKVEDVKEFVEYNRDSPVCRIIDYGLIDIYTITSIDKSPMFYFKIKDLNHPLHEIAWINMRVLAGTNLLEILNDISTINKHTADICF